MFKPKTICIEKKALNYELGQNLYKLFKEQNREVILLTSNRLNILPKEVNERYKIGKKVLVIGEYKTSKFQDCKPSAHYQLPLVSGCMGGCEYCYLNTHFSSRPYTKIYVNFEDILNKTKSYIAQKQGIVIFEGSATSDPIPVEPYTHSLEKMILFFANEERGRFRFVTKYTDIDSLLHLNHKNHTEIRFSINTDYVINNFEHFTPSMNERIKAANKVIEANYPCGFLIAPVIVYDHWKDDYHNLIISLNEQIKKIEHPITFEIISHRYTTTAKNHIMQIFPDTKLEMNDEIRTFKFGQFGYGKYIYPKETMNEIKTFFEEELKHLDFPYEIKYII